jgi:hypothetical protein
LDWDLGQHMAAGFIFKCDTRSLACFLSEKRTTSESICSGTFRTTGREKGDCLDKIGEQRVKHLSHFASAASTMEPLALRTKAA